MCKKISIETLREIQPVLMKKKESEIDNVHYASHFSSFDLRKE